VAFPPGVVNSDTTRGQGRHPAVRPGMWADVCLRLRCTAATPVKILIPRDFRRVGSIMQELTTIDQLVVIMPDRQNKELWQRLWHFTQRKYFYKPAAELLGVPGWSHWALLVDWTKRVIPKDDVIEPDREPLKAELEGKVQRTASSRRTFCKRQLESDGGRVAHME